MANYSFPPTSRYYGLPIAVLVLPDGRRLPYLRRRLVPRPGRFAAIAQYSVQEGDRPDSVAASQIGDPLAFWRLADANAALQPEDMTAQPGRSLRITLPEGFPGPPDA